MLEWALFFSLSLTDSSIPRRTLTLLMSLWLGCYEGTWKTKQSSEHIRTVDKWKQLRKKWRYCREAACRHGSKLFIIWQVNYDMHAWNNFRVSERRIREYIFMACINIWYNWCYKEFRLFKSLYCPVWDADWFTSAYRDKVYHDVANLFF